jgi:hypothetical protein
MRFDAHTGGTRERFSKSPNERNDFAIVIDEVAGRSAYR